MVKTEVSEIPKITYQADMMDELKAAHVLMGIGAPEAAADGVPAAAAAEESRCGGGDEESRPSSKADEINIPPWTLIIPKLEDHTNLLQLPDDQVVGVRLPADLDSVSAATAVMLVPVLGRTMSLLKKKLQKEVAGYDEDDDDDNEEKDVGNQHEMNQEEGEQRKENKHKEDVIVLSDDDEDDEKEKAGKVYSKPLLMKMKVDDLRHLAVKLRLKNSSWDSKEKLVDRIAKALGVCNE
ncbi:putative transcription regulator SAP family [Rosa chinensis]|uniref:Putative transcription regulator SAP family n=2 Tax=Rosa chinensis TaxID=74649 RepID=A0A2P6S636_ROSCH|nr:putative transcription regulator SAP family [Rosa chinensis]